MVKSKNQKVQLFDSNRLILKNTGQEPISAAETSQIKLMF